MNEGLANYVGEVRTMPIGQRVQEDGSILVQTNHRGDPCRPNPCTNVRMSTCTAVNKFTAKCSSKGSLKKEKGNSLLPGEYKRTAAKMDRSLGHGNGQGPVTRRLT